MATHGRQRAGLAAVLIGLLLAGCEAGGLGGVLDADGPYPPDRSLIAAAALPDRAAHARALHLALEDFAPAAHAWSGPGASGSITTLNAYEIDGIVCRDFEDRLETGGQQAAYADVACWGDGWMLQQPDGSFAPVLAAAFEAGPIYEVRRGGNLAAVARRTGVELEVLELWNPALPDRLEPGTRILLP